MNEVYQSDAYIQYATEQASQTEAYFNLGGDSTNTTNTANTADTGDEADDSASITQ
jgi:hypothetical protein